MFDREAQTSQGRHVRAQLMKAVGQLHFGRIRSSAHRLAGLAASGVLFLPGASAQIQLSLQFQSAPVISISGPSATPCELQWSDDLSDSSRWFHLAQQTLGTLVQVSDTNATSVPARYYRAVQVPNINMVLIPAGTFVMGDALSDGLTNERPAHQVFVSDLYMDRFEVTRNLWDDVYLWAIGNGYSFENPGSGKAANHPVEMVNWYDAVKWCNARSQMEGRTPVYYTSGAQTTIYKTGRWNLTNGCVKWMTGGYRLPTEAEWEKAARGGSGGIRFPWGDTISHSNANYYATTVVDYDTNHTNAFHPAFEAGVLPYTSPVGWFPANAYGLSDMIGNVWEWCWDAYDDAWYGKVGATGADPRGPEGGLTNRVLRGGSWITDAYYDRCANRTYSLYESPDSSSDAVGFRCVMSVSVAVLPATLTAPARLPNGAFQFTITGLTPGLISIVALSTNLTSWTPLWTNIPTTGSVFFTNSPSPGVPQQYYRSWQVP